MGLLLLLLFFWNVAFVIAQTHLNAGRIKKKIPHFYYKKKRQTSASTSLDYYAVYD